MNSYFSSDLKRLNAIYNRPQFSSLFLYGVAGSGKTSLVREFCKNKPGLFYSAQETVPARQLSLFCHQAMHSLGTTSISEFTSWKQAFSVINRYSASSRFVLVLDEFQLLAQNDPEFLSAFEDAVIHEFPGGRIFLIITSSDPAFSGQLLSYTGDDHQLAAASLHIPFHARAKLGPLPFSACKQYLTPFSPMEQVLLYSATGGFLANLGRIRQDQSASDNLLRLFFKSNAPFFTHPLLSLHNTLREISTYNYLLEIMAGGCARLADIAGRADIGTNKCAKYLSTLISMDLIEKEIPAVGDPLKKVRYIFSNDMLRFWYRFVFPNFSSILEGKGQEILEQQVLPEVESFLEPAFERIFAEFLEQQASDGQAPFAYKHTGSWWTGGTKREPFLRIPLAFADETHAVLGLCHCKKTPADINLLENISPLPIPFEGREAYILIFSVYGFTQELQSRAADQKNIWLVELEDLLS